MGSEFTKVENTFLDWITSQSWLTSLDWRIVVFILRKTIGWNKEWDKISFSQFQKLKCSRQGIQDSLERLEKHGVIQVERKGKGKINFYKLVKCSCVTSQVELTRTSQAQLTYKINKENKQKGMDTNHSDGDGVIPNKEKYELVFKDGKPSHYKEI